MTPAPRTGNVVSGMRQSCGRALQRMQCDRDAAALSIWNCLDPGGPRSGMRACPFFCSSRSVIRRWSRGTRVRDPNPSPLPTNASTAARSLGTDAVSASLPSSVHGTSSSMRMPPKPRRLFIVKNCLAFLKSTWPFHCFLKSASRRIAGTPAELPPDQPPGQPRHGVLAGMRLM